MVYYYNFSPQASSENSFWWASYQTSRLWWVGVSNGCQLWSGIRILPLQLGFQCWFGALDKLI